MVVQSVSLARNSILKARYKIVNVLGEGSFGITYKAFDLKLNRFCAIKEYIPSMFATRGKDNRSVTVTSKDNISSYKKGLTGFLNEARVLANFRHPNIVEIWDFFEENNTAYIVMPYEEGMDLYKYLQEVNSNLNEDLILKLALPILSGLKEAHNFGLIHRDIKPGNIFIRKNGIPMLIDFGAAREVIGRNSHNFTIVFTPKYAPIEQYSLDKQNQGPWNDIYALGIVLYQLMMGYTDASEIPDAQTRDLHISQGEDDPLVFPKELPYSKKLIDTVKKMTAIYVEDRLKSCNEVLELLINSEPPIEKLNDIIELAGKDSKITDEEEEFILQKAKELNIEQNRAKEYLESKIKSNNWKRVNKIEFIYANLFKRSLAYIIDVIIVAVPFGVFMAALENSSKLSDSDMVLLYIIMGLYFIIFESSSKGATLGKQLFGLKVVDTNGEKISFLRALGRYIAFIFLSIGVIFALFSKKKQTVHDLVANTIVIENRKDIANEKN